MDYHTKMSDEDYEIERQVFLKKVAGLCADFLRKTGDNMISLSVDSKIRDLVTDMHGNECRGVLMEMGVVSWYTNPDADPIEDFGEDFGDDE